MTRTDVSRHGLAACPACGTHVRVGTRWQNDPVCFNCGTELGEAGLDGAAAGEGVLQRLRRLAHRTRSGVLAATLLGMSPLAGCSDDSATADSGVTSDTGATTDGATTGDGGGTSDSTAAPDGGTLVDSNGARDLAAQPDGQQPPQSDGGAPPPDTVRPPAPDGGPMPLYGLPPQP